MPKSATDLVCYIGFLGFKIEKEDQRSIIIRGILRTDIYGKSLCYKNSNPWSKNLFSFRIAGQELILFLC